MAHKIRTVLGDVDPNKLGFILPHEHLITFPPMRVRSDPDYRLQDVGKAIEEVNLFKRAGGTALAEMTTHGYGRDVNALRHISKETGVHIISTTGFIMESLFPPEAFNYTEKQLVDLFVRDIQEGMDGTDIKAGLLKCGTSHDKMTRTEEKVIRAVAKAHHITGATISTHTMGGTMVFSQIEVLKSEGVDLARVIIGHLDRNSLNIGYLKMAARTGVYLEFDNVGKTKYYPDTLRIDMIKQLIDMGFVKQILLADDNGRQSYFASYGGGPGLDYIPKVFVPMLREAGVSEADIEQMTVLNPRTALAFEAR
ncbi:MAG: phosphotriesterase-related protein [Chloroflexi bacterium]|nr:phosphotriesterase-related protein [Chloroflexota bacterium]